MNRLLIAGAAVLAVCLMAYGYGKMQYRQGQRDLVVEIEEARADSVREREEIEDEIKQLDDDDLLERALGYVRRP